MKKKKPVYDPYLIVIEVDLAQLLEDTAGYADIFCYHAEYCEDCGQDMPNSHFEETGHTVQAADLPTGLEE